jgi:hypothetical protein
MDVCVISDESDTYNDNDDDDEVHFITFFSALVGARPLIFAFSLLPFQVYA